MEMPEMREKFDNKYEIKQSGCWEWSGYRLPKGYGYLNIGGKPTGAHRVSYMIHKGEIPKGMHVHHICENTCCVNPDHLTILTPEANLKLNSSPVADNARKEFCKRGHEFNENNTRYTKRNGKLHRRCRECHNQNCKQKRHRDKTNHSRIVEALKAENEDLRAKLERMKWQPIETTPEGRNVLVWYSGGVEIAWRYGRDWQMDTKKIQYQPTHWMPLPEPPK